MTEATDSSTLEQSRFFERMMFSLCMLVIIAFGVARYLAPEFGRDIGIDERITLQEYTWAGILSDGARNELRMHEQIQSIRGCSPRRFVMGCWASLGRWTEPNNQILHSLMVNVSLLVVPDTLRAIRLPALIAAIGFSTCCFAMCIRAGWVWTAPLITVVSFFHPYVIEYSQSNRGYALMLFLCSLTLLILACFFKNPNHAWISVALSASLVGLFLTLVSMIADWIVPLFLAMGIYILYTQRLDTTEGKTLLSRLALQATFVISIVVCFVCDRLPYLISSAKQYGIPFSNANELVQLVRAFAIYLCPTLNWAVFFLCCISGFWIAIRRSTYTPLLLVLISVFLVSILHFVGGGKFPYERNVGYFIIHVLFGFAVFFSIALKQAKSTGHWVMLYVSGWVIAGSAVFSTIGFPIPDYAYQEMVAKVRSNQIPIAQTDLVIAVRESRELTLYLQWGNPQKSKHEQLVILQNRNFPVAFQGKDGASIAGKFTKACGNPRVSTDLYSLWAMALVESEKKAVGSEKLAIAVWRIPFPATAVSPDSVLEELREEELAFFEINERYQAKMEVFQRLTCVIVPIFADEGPTQVSRTQESLDSVANKFGGEIQYFIVTQSTRPEDLVNEAH